MNQQLRLCTHIMADGQQCQSPALRLYAYCRHHRRYHAVAPLPDYARPALASPRQVQAALMRGVGEVMSGELSPESFIHMAQLFARKRPRRTRRNFRSS